MVIPRIRTPRSTRDDNRHAFVQATRSALHRASWLLPALLLLATAAHAQFDLYYVAYTPRSTSLVVVDGATGTVRKRLRLGGFAGLDGSFDNKVFVNPMGRYLYVYLRPGFCPTTRRSGRSSGDRCLVEIDRLGHRIVRLLPDIPTATVALLEPSGQTLFLGIQRFASQAVDVLALDLASGVSREFELSDRSAGSAELESTPNVLVPYPDVRRLLLVRNLSRVATSSFAPVQLLLFDGTTGTILDRIQLPEPEADAFLPGTPLPLQGDRILLRELRLDSSTFFDPSALLRLFDLPSRQVTDRATVPAFLSSTVSGDSGYLIAGSLSDAMAIAINVNSGPSFGQSAPLVAVGAIGTIFPSPNDPSLSINVTDRIQVIDYGADEILLDVPLVMDGIDSPASSFIAAAAGECPTGDHTCYCRTDSDCDDGDTCTVDVCDGTRGCSYRTPSCLDLARCPLDSLAAAETALAGTPCARAARRAARLAARASRVVSRLDTAPVSRSQGMLQRATSLAKAAAAVGLRISLPRQRGVRLPRAARSALRGPRLEVTCADQLIAPLLQSIRRLRTFRTTMAACLSDPRRR
jgi:hypothetical protein